MKAQLEKFYNENPSAFQILGVLFVITGLVINIPSSTGWLGQSIEHLKFFLLVTSGILLLYLIYNALSFFLKPVLDIGQGKTLHHIVKKLAVSFFFISIAIFFLIDLCVYIILSYPHESIFLATLLLCYFVLIQLSKISMVKKWWTRLWTILLVLLLVAIPIGAYVFLYLNSLNLIWYMIVGVIALAVILYVILSIQLKVSESKPLLGDKDTPVENTTAPSTKND
jgi:hypothetical protein